MTAEEMEASDRHTFHGIAGLQHAAAIGPPRGFPIQLFKQPRPKNSRTVIASHRDAQARAPDDRLREAIELWRRRESSDGAVASRLALQTHVRASRRDAPESLHEPYAPEGVGNAGCPGHPQPRARK
jgi:hypothetical protein